MSSATALTVREDAAVVADARELSVEQIIEIASSSDKRAMVMGVVTSAVAMAMMTIAGPVGVVAAAALVPAFLAGYFAATRAGNRAAAAAHGVTVECMREVRRAFGRVQMKQDVRKIPLKDWGRSDIHRLATEVKDELAKTASRSP